MSITRADTPERSPTEVIYLPWSEFAQWLAGKRRSARAWDGTPVPLPPPWRPGQHWALVGKTREGKTNFAVCIMAARKWVLAVDPKGGDETLARAGYTHISGVPPAVPFPRKVSQRLSEGTPVRLVAGRASTRTRDDDEANRALMADVLEYVRQSGGWTLYVDEYQILADGRMYKLGPAVERMLISAARDKTSVITAFQAPAWVPKASTRQATLITVWRTRDQDMVKAVSQAAGRNWRTVGAVIDELPKYHALTISDDPRAPMLITKPPEI